MIAVELLMAAQAIDLAPARAAATTGSRRRPAPCTTCVRSRIPYQDRDEVLYPRIEAAEELVRSGAVLDAAGASPLSTTSM